MDPNSTHIPNTTESMPQPNKNMPRRRFACIQEPDVDDEINVKKMIELSGSDSMASTYFDKDVVRMLKDDWKRSLSDLSKIKKGKILYCNKDALVVSDIDMPLFTDQEGENLFKLWENK